MISAATKINELEDIIAEFVHDPLAFVEFVFPWGEAGTPLAHESGPDKWQVEVLESIRDGLYTAEDGIRLAVKSGHGIGKSALIAWIILWFISTRPHPQVVTTANTKQQLEQKTWRELAKWHKLAIHKDWFEWTATKFYHASNPETWFAAATPWSKERSEAFAGTHERYVLMVFDEASNIEDVIWEVAEGAMTTSGSMWIAFGNPTRNTGRFRECWGKFRHRWNGLTVDSRTAKMANKRLIEQWIEDYGEDSDFVRVRAKGEFPRAATNQFIASDIVEIAAARQLSVQAYSHAPKVLGVDVARFGDDKTVLLVRQGLKVLHMEAHMGKDTMWTAAKAIELSNRFRCDAEFIDDTGVGGGVTDRMRQLNHSPIPVNAGSTATNDKKYFNKRVEMWGEMRDWLKAGGQIPDDQELKDDLIGPEYGFDAKQRIQLEKKQDMKERGLASPDKADSLALTFAYPLKEYEEDDDDYDERRYGRSKVGGY